MPAAPAKKPAAKSARAPSKAPKTQPTGTAIHEFLSKVDAPARADCEKLDGWMREATGDAGSMYGSAIAGYGHSIIQYADGREAPWMKMGFSPRKAALTLYGVLRAATPELLEQLGEHSTGKGCLYVKRLADVNEDVLRKMISHAAKA